MTTAATTVPQRAVPPLGGFNSTLLRIELRWFEARSYAPGTGCSKLMRRLPRYM